MTLSVLCLMAGGSTRDRHDRSNLISGCGVGISLRD